MSKEIKGTVLEVNTLKKHIIILTPDSSIQKIDLPAEVPSVGEEIISYQAKSYGERRSFFGKAVAIAATIILTFGLATFLHLFFTVSTYVALDINPSIELKVNRYNRVIGADAFNREGELFLEKFPAKYNQIEDIIDQFVESAILENYIRADKENFVMIAYYTVKSVPEFHPEKMQANIIKMLDNRNIPYHVMVNMVNKDLREKSRRENKSMNVTYLYDLLHENKIAVNPENLRDEPGEMIADIEKKLGDIPNSVRDAKKSEKKESDIPLRPETLEEKQIPESVPDKPKTKTEHELPLEPEANPEPPEEERESPQNHRRESDQPVE